MQAAMHHPHRSASNMRSSIVRLIACLLAWLPAHGVAQYVVEYLRADAAGGGVGAIQCTDIAHLKLVLFAIQLGRGHVVSLARTGVPPAEAYSCPADLDLDAAIDLWRLGVEPGLIMGRGAEALQRVMLAAVLHRHGCCLFEWSERQLAETSPVAMPEAEPSQPARAAQAALPSVPGLADAVSMSASAANLSGAGFPADADGDVCRDAKADDRDWIAYRTSKGKGRRGPKKPGMSADARGPCLAHEHASASLAVDFNPNIRVRELVHVLHARRWTLLAGQGRGSHRVFQHGDGRKVTVNGGDGDTLAPGTLKKILKTVNLLAP
jgi:predicted RNA binding protein YcfA (HicA-like mRNA interferase family)